MDISKFIDDNLDEIISNPSEFIIDKKDNKPINIREIYKELDEEEFNEDHIQELFESIHLKNDKSINNFITINDDSKYVNLEQKEDDKKEDEEKEDDGMYYIYLINIFMKYYNNKFDKNKHFFSDIVDTQKDTSNQMELFFDTIMEYKIIKEENKYNNDEMMKYYFSHLQKDKIKKLFEEHKGQIYSLEIKDLKYISPSLLVLLNFLHEHNILEINDSEWNIYSLKNIE
jgi:hypothetical protein